MEKLLHERLHEYVAENGDDFDLDALKSHLGTGAITSADDLNGCIRAIASEIERFYTPRPRYEDGEVVQIGDRVKGLDEPVVAYDSTYSPSGIWFHLYGASDEVEGDSFEKEEVVEERPIDERGRDAAARYLESKGYEIVERDWACRFGTIDIIAKDPYGTLCFIDVKTRQYHEEDSPSDDYTRIGRKQFEKIALCYLMVRDDFCEDEELRLDHISICVIGKHRAMLTHAKRVSGLLED